jgi:hypothetical protein
VETVYPGKWQLGQGLRFGRDDRYQPCGRAVRPRTLSFFRRPLESSAWRSWSWGEDAVVRYHKAAAHDLLGSVAALLIGHVLPRLFSPEFRDRSGSYLQCYRSARLPRSRSRPGSSCLMATLVKVTGANLLHVPEVGVSCSTSRISVPRGASLRS